MFTALRAHRRKPARGCGRLDAASPRVLLVGYFERGNLGDDAMHDALRDWFASWDGGACVRSLPLPPLGALGWTNLWAMLQALRWADAVILGGGTHFHDRFGLRSYRILAAFNAMFMAARLSGAKVGYAGIGIGSVSSRLGRAMVRSLLRLANACLVRDTASLDAAARLGHSEAICGFDVAVLLEEPGPRARTEGERVGVSLVPYFAEYEDRPGDDLAFAQAVAGALDDAYADADVTVALYALFVGIPHSDLELCHSVANMVDGRLRTEVIALRSPGHALEEFARASTLLATRYHAAVLGFVVGVPTVFIAYEEKCRAFAAEAGVDLAYVVTPREIVDGLDLADRLRRVSRAPETPLPKMDLDEARTRAREGLVAFHAQLGLARG